MAGTLTRAGYTLLGAAIGLLTAGLAAGNFFYATVSLVPLGVFLTAALLDAPHRIEARLDPGKASPRAGEEIEVRVDYRAEAGSGPFEIHVALPDVVEMAQGSNLHVLTKPRAEVLEGHFTFTVRWTKRGKYALGPVTVEAVHPAGLRAPAHAEAFPALEIEVRPPQEHVRRVRGLPGLAKQMFPENDQATTGIRTTEFREIREYVPGDPIKYINWKASTRQAGFHAGTQPPLVNEYEREGKKVVWLFFDAAPYMQVGTNVQNSFEHALSAVNGLASFYLARGYKLGFYVYNHNKQAFLYPEAGHGQRLEIQRVLTQLAPGPDATEGLFNAVERARRFLLEDKPLVIIVTRIGKADERTFQALKKLRALTGRRRRKLPVLVVSPIVHGAIPRTREYDGDLVQLLRRYDRPNIARARRMGARVVEWDPSGASLQTLLLKGGGPAP